MPSKAASAIVVQVSLLVQKPSGPCPTKKDEMENMRASSLVFT